MAAAIAFGGSANLSLVQYSVFWASGERVGVPFFLDMHYREVLPHPSLREFVKCLWTLQHDYSQSIHAQEQLSPRGEIELIFHYGDPFMLRDGNNWVRQPGS